MRVVDARAAEQRKVKREVGMCAKSEVCAKSMLKLLLIRPKCLTVETSVNE
jgi:hypothetical protein